MAGSPHSAASLKSDAGSNRSTSSSALSSCSSPDSGLVVAILLLSFFSVTQRLDGQDGPPEGRVGHRRERCIPGNRGGRQAEPATHFDEPGVFTGIADAEQEEGHRQQEEDTRD